MLTVAIGCPSRSRVELTVVLIDLDDRAIRRLHQERAAPLLVDDRAFGRKAGRVQAPLDQLERLIDHEVEGHSASALTVGGGRTVVETELATGRSELEPMSGARTDLEVQTERLIEAQRLREVRDEVDRPDPHPDPSCSRRSRYATSASSTIRDSEAAWSTAACLTRRISAGDR